MPSHTSRALAAATITVAANANAVLPLVAREEITEHLRHAGAGFNAFQSTTVVLSCLTLVAGPLLLRGRRLRTVLRWGFGVMALANALLALTALEWAPLPLRGVIGLAYGLVVPLGQFVLSGLSVSPAERVRLFTLNINLIRLALVLLPLLGSLLLLVGGNAVVLFWALTLIALTACLLAPGLVPTDARLQGLPPRAPRLPPAARLTALADALLILIGRGVYALALILISARQPGHGGALSLSLVFTVPFALAGLAAGVVPRRLEATQSGLLLLWLPLLVLAGVMAVPSQGAASGLILLVALVGLIGLPLSFAPGQFIAQWPDAASRQWANVITILLMTLPLSLGPWLYSSLEGLAGGLSGPAWPEPQAMATAFLLLCLPLLLLLQRLWRRAVIPDLLRPDAP
ncbi:hypothetical protein EVJ50_08930 [Synechococcus sp. RSCCF101]|uniref:hypothetical protein n=1 Tax=Synechococcus sp. RSCCF101 TaxID=2511069 RepID=UPI001243A3DC|nr:hypothetical protein [Synechococcus sp. RSCCF101]QEY32325.1 hypothetical protein EVJ50_08930 [Synechococcus sp. RSCCF101]